MHQKTAFTINDYPFVDGDIIEIDKKQFIVKYPSIKNKILLLIGKITKTKLNNNTIFLKNIGN